MYRDLLAMKIDIEMLKTAFGKSLKVGPIEQVDAKKGYRIRLGEDENGEPFLSPWYPHPESGGATSTWAPLSKGQIVGMINPTGDARQGILLRGGFSDVNQPPSADLLANVLKAFGVTVTVKNGTVTIDGNLVVKGNVDFKDGHVKHNEANIGDTHIHGGVDRGGATTDEPAN
ncbi:phage baseplate assembly protein V [Brucella anthropi]|nr:phage baseplate assembly protein V [Brucella anthropi]RRY13338.1 baseplate assembly protein [Brucella anthropi]